VVAAVPSGNSVQGYQYEVVTVTSPVMRQGRSAPRTFKRRFGGGGRGRLASADGAGYPEARRV